MSHVYATLRPSFVRIFYHSVLSAHVMSIPTRQWNPLAGTNGQGGYENWNSAEVDADDMIQFLALGIANLFPTTSEVDSYIIYNYPTAAEIFVPVAGNAIAVAGTDATPGQNAAVQKTFTFYDTEFHTSKLVLLDGATDNLWTKQTPGTANAFELALADALMDADWAWASRNGQRPATLRSVATTLNRRLRRNYNYG